MAQRSTRSIWAGPANVGAPADALPVTAGGHAVYGVSFSGDMGYRHAASAGVAVNGQAEGMYMVTSGTHVNNRCCLGYGNAEVRVADTGNGHMDAINFGTECWFAPCSGSGPWVQADLENQLLRQPMDGSAVFRADATFCPQAGRSGQGTSFASYNYPTRFLRHYNNNVYIASNGGPNAFDSANSWADDVSWAVGGPWAP